MQFGDRAEAVRSQMMYDAQRKSVGVAYLLLIFLGGLGAHRFYLGRTGSAAAMLAMTLIGWLTVAIGIGLLVLVAVGVWWFIDLFLVPGMARDHNLALADHLTGNLPARY